MSSHTSLTQSAKSHSRVYNDDCKNTPWYARNFDMEMQTLAEKQGHKLQRGAHSHSHTYNHLFVQQVEGVHALYFLSGTCKVYI